MGLWLMPTFTVGQFTSESNETTKPVKTTTRLSDKVVMRSSGEKRTGQQQIHPVNGCVGLRKA
jgi:hypothetical protein